MGAFTLVVEVVPFRAHLTDSTLEKSTAERIQRHEHLLTGTTVIPQMKAELAQNTFGLTGIVSLTVINPVENRVEGRVHASIDDQLLSLTTSDASADGVLGSALA